MHAKEVIIDQLEEEKKECVQETVEEYERQLHELKEQLGMRGSHLLVRVDVVGVCIGYVDCIRFLCCYHLPRYLQLSKTIAEVIGGKTVILLDILAKFLESNLS
jgi:hypothetical protein